LTQSPILLALHLFVTPINAQTSEMTYQPLEHEVGAAYRAAAAAAFVSAVVQYLPDAVSADSELRAIPNDEHADDAVLAWTQRWSIDCPCVREWARGDVIVRSTAGRGARLVAVSTGRDVSDEWWRNLEELNNTVLDASGRDPRDVFTSDHSGRVVEKHRSSSPIAANPVAESLDQFVERARQHWHARAELARALGYRSIAPRPQLERDAMLLAQHQMDGRSIRELAATWQLEPAALRKALTTLRQTLGLAPRQNRGRPAK
jgi:hypothetical protein